MTRTRLQTGPDAIGEGSRRPAEWIGDAHIRGADVVRGASREEAPEYALRAFQTPNGLCIVADCLKSASAQDPQREQFLNLYTLGDGARLAFPGQTIACVVEHGYRMGDDVVICELVKSGT